MQGHDLGDGDTVVNKAAMVSVAVDVTVQCEGCGINNNKAQDDLRAKREFCTSAIKVGLLGKWHLSENQKKAKNQQKKVEGEQGLLSKKKNESVQTQHQRYDLRTYQMGSYFA